MLLNFVKVKGIKSFSSGFCKTLATEMTKTALVFLAPGAEEMEFIIATDVLTRGGVNVTVAGLPKGDLVLCSRGAQIKPDISVTEACSRSPFDALVLPGGLQGAKALAESEEVGELLKKQEQRGGIIAAICAAPTALKAHEILLGRSLTSYPAMEKDLGQEGAYKYQQDDVVVDGNLITSRGPGTSFQFALTIVEALVGKAKASEVAKGMLIDY